jgi:hypothetical protein
MQRLIDQSSAHLIGTNLETAPASGLRGRWTITPDGRTVTRPDGATVDLSKRRTLRRLLVALARRRIEGDGQPVKHDDLIDAAWPGDRCRRASALNRLAFSICELRRLGLREILERTPGAYYLTLEATVSWTVPPQPVFRATGS